MGPLLKYGIPLGIFATTFYFSYSGAEVQKMTLGDLFDNPIPYGQNGNTTGIYNETLNALACLISNGSKQNSKCTNNANDNNSKPYIHKYNYMKLYPEVEKIFNDSWKTQSGDDQTFENSKLMPKLVAWCNKKRKEYVTVLDQQLLWHMSLFCSIDSKPFK